MTSAQTSLVPRVALLVAGPVAIGAASMLRADPQFGHALALPALWVGVLFVMLPTLYIGAALLQIAPSAIELGRAATSALERSSIVFLGLAPALAFSIATSVEARTADVLSAVVLALGAVLGLGVFYRLIFGDRHRARALALFAAWSVVSLAIGAHLYSAIRTVS